MTDPELVAKELARIETCVRELRALARPERIREDIRERRFVERTLQLGIQAALDAASHIVSDERLGEPRTNRELFDLLERAGWIAPEMAAVLRDMVGFRNILVYGYDTVNLENRRRCDAQSSGRPARLCRRDPQAAAPGLSGHAGRSVRREPLPYLFLTWSSLLTRTTPSTLRVTRSA